MSEIVKEESNRKNLDQIYRVLLKILCGLFLFCSFIPYSIVKISSSSDWTTINGNGIFLSRDLVIISPTFLTIFVIKIIILINIWHLSNIKPLWNDLRHFWILFFILLGTLFTKRQAMYILFQNNQYIMFKAQDFAIPHLSIGYFAEFFVLSLMLGFFISLAFLYDDNDISHNERIQKLVFVLLILFLFPWFMEFNSNSISVGLGFGYTFMIQNSHFYNAASIQAWIFQIILIILHCLLISPKISKKIQWGIETIIIILFFVYLNCLGHMNVNIYMLGNSFTIKLPAMTPIFTVFTLLQGKLSWNWFTGTILLFKGKHNPRI